MFMAALMVVLLHAAAAVAAPYAELVMDMRTGEVLQATNSDTRLHPASLTKMMTLYIAFEAIERGEISLDSRVTVSRFAASQPPSKLGLRAGQTIALRYLIRAAAIKSANDAATAIGEAIEGSEPAFAKRMNRTAKALGMTRSTFVNANGLTAKGHMSTARDMATLGRHLFYDFPQYYNVFSRRSADAGIAQVNSTNRRFLDSYEGADGIKTGYTVPAGFNLVASAQRGDKRIVAAIFGGKSTAQRNARMAELLDMGFGKAPNRATVQKPERPEYVAKAPEDLVPDAPEFDSEEAIAAALSEGVVAAGKTIRLQGAVEKSLRPRPRPVPGAQPEEAPVAEAPQAPLDELLLSSMQDDIAAALAEAQATLEDTSEPETEEPVVVAEAGPAPVEGPVFAQETAPQPETLELGAEPKAAEAGTALALLSSPAPKPSPAAAEAEQVSPSVAEAAEPALPETVEAPVVEAPKPLVAAKPAAPAAEEPTAAPVVVVNTPDANETPLPRARPAEVILAAAPAIEPESEEPLEVVTRVSTSGGRQWAISVGNYPSRYAAERMLLQTALIEMNTLDEALRKVVSRKGGFDATFVGMTEEMANLACRRLAARQAECSVVGP